MPPSTREPGDSTGAEEDLELCRSCPRVILIKVAESESRSSLPFACRKADRAASKWWTTSSVSKDTAGGLLRAKRGDESEEDISDREKAVTFTGGGGNGLDPTDPTQAVLQWRKRAPEGDGMSEAKS
jgi:hypothetical protein